MQHHIYLLLFAAYYCLTATVPREGWCADLPAKRDAPAGRTQIIYYSCTGNTRVVAETLRDTFGCTLQEIEDKKDRSVVCGQETSCLR